MTNDSGYWKEQFAKLRRDFSNAGLTNLSAIERGEALIAESEQQLDLDAATTLSRVYDCYAFAAGELHDYNRLDGLADGRLPD